MKAANPDAEAEAVAPRAPGDADDAIVYNVVGGSYYR
jgi:hypothetical protein